VEYDIKERVWQNKPASNNIISLLGAACQQVYWLLHGVKNDAPFSIISLSLSVELMGLQCDPRILLPMCRQHHGVGALDAIHFCYNIQIY
jgi:hypothetical protein